MPTGMSLPSFISAATRGLYGLGRRAYVVNLRAGHVAGDVIVPATAPILSSASSVAVNEVVSSIPSRFSGRARQREGDAVEARTQGDNRVHAPRIRDRAAKSDLA